MPDDIVTQLDRRRPVTDTELLRRADWIRLQTIDLIRQAESSQIGRAHV